MATIRYFPDPKYGIVVQEGQTLFEFEGQLFISENFDEPDDGTEFMETTAARLFAPGGLFNTIPGVTRYIPATSEDMDLFLVDLEIFSHLSEEFDLDEMLHEGEGHEGEESHEHHDEEHEAHHHDDECGCCEPPSFMDQIHEVLSLLSEIRRVEILGDGGWVEHDILEITEHTDDTVVIKVERSFIDLLIGDSVTEEALGEGAEEQAGNRLMSSREIAFMNGLMDWAAATEMDNMFIRSSCDCGEEAPSVQALAIVKGEEAANRLEQLMKDLGES